MHGACPANIYRAGRARIDIVIVSVQVAVGEFSASSKDAIKREGHPEPTKHGKGHQISCATRPRSITSFSHGGALRIRGDGANGVRQTLANTQDTRKMVALGSQARFVPGRRRAFFRRSVGRSRLYAGSRMVANLTGVKTSSRGPAREGKNTTEYWCTSSTDRNSQPVTLESGRLLRKVRWTAVTQERQGNGCRGGDSQPKFGECRVRPVLAKVPTETQILLASVHYRVGRGDKVRIRPEAITWKL